jgi:hypothetical protein
MRRKNKLTRLVNRPGVKRCPHCDGTLPPRKDEPTYVTVTEEEKHVIVCRMMARAFTRDELLNLLAHHQPALRALVADVYPLSPPTSSGGIPLEPSP